MRGLVKTFFPSEKQRLLSMVFVALIFAGGIGQNNSAVFPVPRIAFRPRHYFCFFTPQAIHIDGKPEEPAWRQARWTANFVDIEGELKPSPPLRTRVKMLWDSLYFYIFAEMEEPDLWATLTRHDAVIYHDNDFEVFIDPDGDTHRYYELEFNALNTVWDLYLDRPYRDDNCALDGWEATGLKSAVFVDGTLNRPGDRDRGWSIEIAIPWAVLAECGGKSAPPQPGDIWRVNFSRVEWRLEVHKGEYRKKLNPVTGKPYPEDNWVWSPQGLINMHYPEMWGFVQFSGETGGNRQEEFKLPPEEKTKWKLRQVYYREKTYFLNHGHYTSDLNRLFGGAADRPPFADSLRIRTTFSGFEAVLPGPAGNWHINQYGRVWKP